jgi:hypothetical protein
MREVADHVAHDKLDIGLPTSNKHSKSDDLLLAIQFIEMIDQFSFVT